MTDAALYSAWLKCLFDHNEDDGEIDAFSDERIYSLPANNVLDLFTLTWQNYHKDVTGYSNWQISQGIMLAVNSDYSDLGAIMLHGAHDDDKPEVEKQTKAIQSIKLLFSECFNTRCDHLFFERKQVDNPLNSVCYDFWRTTAITNCKPNPHSDTLYNALADSMAFGLSLDNVACQQSAIRGLSDLSIDHKDASRSIEQYIDQNPNLSSTMLDYAKAGMARRVW